VCERRTVLPGEGTPGAASNDSEATETTSPPSVLKEVAVPPATPGGAVNCNTATYVAEPTQPVYANGDTICFQLEATAPRASTPRTRHHRHPPAQLDAGSRFGDRERREHGAGREHRHDDGRPGDLDARHDRPGRGSNLYVPPGAIFSYDLAVKPTADPAAATPSTSSTT